MVALEANHFQNLVKPCFWSVVLLLTSFASSGVIFSDTLQDCHWQIRMAGKGQYSDTKLFNFLFSFSRVDSKFFLLTTKIKLCSLTLYTLTSVYIFSILFLIYFLRCWQGEFVKQSRVPFIVDHFSYSCDLNEWFWGDIVRRN